ncbi:MAG: FAD-dependent monooxygenase [Hyphomicrobiales bacterium]
MSENSKTITIIGAGIAGLTTALTIAQAAKKHNQKLKIQIHERANEPSEEGAGLQLSPNATHILRQIGVLPKLIECAGRPKNIIMAEGRTGNQIADIPLGDYAEQRYGAPYLVVHRADLHNILCEQTKQYESISIEFGREINKTQNSSDLYIAADGVWSKTRKNLKPHGETAQFSSHIAWRSLIDAPELVKKYQNSTHVWLGNKSHLVLYPIENGNKLNLVAFTEGDLKQKDWAQTADIAELKNHLKHWNDDVFSLLAAAKDMKIWPLFACKHGYQSAKDNILFIGDAAHSTLPYQAQGAAMAIEDAACLANLLYEGAENWHEWNAQIIPLKLRVYEQSRHDRVTKTQNAAQQNAKIFHLTPPVSVARNLYLRILSKFMPHKLLTRLDWLYAKRYDNY